MKRSTPLFLALGLAFCAAGVLPVAAAADVVTATPVRPIYTVDVYDPKRDPAADLKTTIKKAEAEGKRILVQVGGDWCGWCHLMNKYFHDNPKVAAALARDFLILKVNLSDENRNEPFLSKYPRAEGYPHVYVLESDGKFLHSQGTGVLEEGKGYSEARVLGFLSRWAPKKSPDRP